MSEEDVVPAVEPAPEQEPTATPEPEVSEPETTAEKTFTQAEIDAAIGKRIAREQRKWAREQHTQAPPTEAPTPEAFENPEAHLEAMAEYKAAQLVEKREAEKARAATEDAYLDRVEEAQEKYADFDQVAKNPRLPVTQVMAEAITSSEIGPDILYHLGLNPKEAARIAQLGPLMQAKEIGKIEAKLASDPPAKKTTSAPAPINPVNTQTAGKTYDTTDPRSIKAMSTSEWIAAERARQIKKAQAAR
jgi:hypothetical protein